MIKKNFIFRDPFNPLLSTLPPRWDTLYFFVRFIFLCDHVSWKIDLHNAYIITITPSTLHCTASNTIHYWISVHCKRLRAGSRILDQKALKGTPKIEFFLITQVIYGSGNSFFCNPGPCGQWYWRKSHLKTYWTSFCIESFLFKSGQILWLICNSCPWRKW